MGVRVAYSLSLLVPSGPPLLNLGNSGGRVRACGISEEVLPGETPFESLKVVSLRGVGKGQRDILNNDKTSS